MPNIPCEHKINQCDCSDDPFSNLSSEAPDVDRFISNVFFDGTGDLRLNESFEQLGCFAFCLSPISQEDADDCARDQAELCSVGTDRTQSGSTGGRPGTPIPLFVNTAQSCNIQCPDGSNFGWTVGAGTVIGRTQIEADSLAFSLACQRARFHRICIGNTFLPSACKGQSYSFQFAVSGGIRPLNFAIIAGSLPAGLSLNNLTGVISGVAIGSPATSGFTLRIIDDVGIVTTKTFTLTVVGITTVSPLTVQLLVPFSQQLTLGPAHDTATELWTVVGGALPMGITLSEGGLLNGTASDVTQMYPFLVEVIATFPNTTEVSICTFSMSIDLVVALPTPLAYWKMEEAGAALRIDQINGIGLTPTASAAFGIASVSNGPGIIGNAAKFDATALGAPGGAFVCKLATAASQVALAYQGAGLHLTGWFKATVSNTDSKIFAYDLFGGCSLILQHGDTTTAPNVRLILSAPGVTTLSFPFNPQDGQFHFISAFYDKVTATLGLQFDNNPIQTIAGPAAIVGAGIHANFIMESDTGVAFVDSSCSVLWDEWAIWGDKLTDDQVAVIYNSGIGRTCCPFA